MSSKESIKIGNNRRIQMDTSFGILPRSWSRLVSLSTGCPQRLLQAIRNMEPAWLKVNGGNFSLVEYRDKKGQLRPCYSLTKTECLYIATKFNDEARAKLLLLRGCYKPSETWSQHGRKYVRENFPSHPES